MNQRNDLADTSSLPATSEMLDPAGSPVAWGTEPLAQRNAVNARHQARVAAARPGWIEKNWYYYDSLKRLLCRLAEPGKRVLNIRCQTGFLLAAMKPSSGAGVEISSEMVEIARRENPGFEYSQSFPEQFAPSGVFDYILFNDIGETVDVQRALLALRPACERHTRLLIYTYNHLWQPLVSLAERLGMKIPQPQQNWLSEADIRGLLELSDFEWLKTYRVILCPKYIPLLSAVLNRVVAKLPGIQRLCMVQVLVARLRSKPAPQGGISVSVIVPCKDERGNIEQAVLRVPELGSGTELIFCDDKSLDGTADEVRRMQQLYPERRIRLVDGPGICKSKNVWTGFRAASGDVLMILDADLTVMPEELPLFFDAITSGKAEFVNGSRLVYPVPKGAMKAANMAGNKIFSWVFTYLMGQPIKDTLCGTKVLWRSDWKRIEPMVDAWGIMDRWGDYELLFGAAALNLRCLDQPVHYQERIYGVTKMTNVLKNGLIMLRMCVHGFKRLKIDY